MAIELMASRPDIGVRRKEVRHSSGEIWFRCLQYNVEMILQDLERVNPPRAPHSRSSQVLDEAVPIGIIADDILPPVTPGHQMTNLTTILDAQSPRHEPHFIRPLGILQAIKL
jgi:hypothetical protein